jgi:hypothetical protein
VSKTTVVCSRTQFDYDVYIGRPSIWGNPYVVGSLTSAEAVRRYRAHVLSSPSLLTLLPTLRDKVLACPCRNAGTSRPCHGNVLVELIDGPDPSTRRFRP